MANEILSERVNTDMRRLGAADFIKRILPRGHVIHGYSSANNARMLMVLESRKYSDDAPLLGFGMDGTAERALARALFTYGMREQRGLEYVTEDQFPEMTGGGPIGGSRSRFDNIVFQGDFWMYQEGVDVIAGSTYGGGRVRPLEVSSVDPLAAIEALAAGYDYGNNQLAGLPLLSFA